jgi:carboxypeptidase Taq
MEAIKRFFVWLMEYVHEGAFLSRFRALFHRRRRARIAPVNPVPPAQQAPVEAPVVVRQYEEHPSEAYMELKYRFRDIGRLKAIAETMGRDFLTAMPEGAWRSRLGQIAYLHRLVHEKLTGTDMKRLLDRAREHLAQNPEDWDEWDSANLREMTDIQECDGAVTGDIVERRARLEYEGRRRHRDALAQSDWPGAREFLSGQVDLARQIAELRAKASGRNSMYQALMDEYLPGVSEISVADWFGDLHKRLHKLLPQAMERQSREEPPREIGDFYPAKAQMWLNKALLQAIGFDFERGGLYETGHNPVEGGTPDDTRLVIKTVDIRNFMTSMKSALHEGGHGVYTQNLPRKTWRYQPVGQDMGSAVHESQALLVEMIIGRTRAFFNFLSPRAEGLFHGLQNPVLSAENLHRIKTRVKPSPDRKTADELTYFFHVEHRYRLEKEMIEGRLKVADLPDAWNAQMQDILGIQPKNMAEGCLQDVHWFVGKFGYFPAYTVGHMLAAQQFEAMAKEIPDINGAISEGRFAPITDWLRRNIHSKGCLLDFDALVKQATGAAAGPDALVRHLDRRYVKAAA